MQGNERKKKKKRGETYTVKYCKASKVTVTQMASCYNMKFVSILAFQ